MISRDTLDTLAATVQRTEFDHPFTVHPDGTVTDAPAGVYAPEVWHDDDRDIDGYDPDAWQALTGMTGQYSYNGAVMHSSEYVGSGIAAYLVELADDAPVTFVLVVVNVLPTVTYPHHWSPSGARCTECGLIGNGTDNGSCPAHPDYDAASVDDDEDPEPAGWAIMRLV